MAACFARSGSILDGMAPHLWQGPTAAQDWYRDVLVEGEQAGAKDYIVKLGETLRTDVTGDAAYVVSPATMTFKLRGKQITQTGAIFTTAFEGVDELLQRLPRGRFSDRNKALAVLASYRGISSRSISKFLGIDPRSCGKYLRTFDQGSVVALFARRKSPIRKFDNESIKQAVFALLHEPPANHGINRTTWKMQDFRIALRAWAIRLAPM